MRNSGERMGKTLIPRLEKILSRRSRTTVQIVESLYRRWPKWKFMPSVTKITSILGQNPKFAKLTIIKNPKPGGANVALWCLTRRIERERKAIIKTIFDQIN